MPKTDGGNCDRLPHRRPPRNARTRLPRQSTASEYALYQAWHHPPTTPHPEVTKQTSHSGEPSFEPIGIEVLSYRPGDDRISSISLELGQQNLVKT